jgi:hypothetical protein
MNEFRIAVKGQAKDIDGLLFVCGVQIDDFHAASLF